MLNQKIQKISPHLAPFLDEERSLQNYAKALRGKQTSPAFVERQQILTTVVTNRFRRLFPEIRELPIPLEVNMADHHTPINHPLMLASNVIGNADRLLTKEPDPIIVFAGAIVSATNYYNLRGFELSGQTLPLVTGRDEN